MSTSISCPSTVLWTYSVRQEILSCDQNWRVILNFSHWTLQAGKSTECFRLWCRSKSPFQGTMFFVPCNIHFSVKIVRYNDNKRFLSYFLLSIRLHGIVYTFFVQNWNIFPVKSGNIFQESKKDGICLRFFVTGDTFSESITYPKLNFFTYWWHI